MREWMGLFETTVLRRWVEDNLRLYDQAEYLSDEWHEMIDVHLDDLTEVFFEPDGSLQIARELRFVDATEFVSTLKPGQGLGEYWTFDMHRAHSYSAAKGHNDKVVIYAKLAPEHQQNHDMISEFLSWGEAEVRLAEGTPIVVTRIVHRGDDVRSDLVGKQFHA